MSFFGSFLFKLLAVSYFVPFLKEVSTGSLTTIRGIMPDSALLYDPMKDFTCFDNSKTIPFLQVNDDFCDCADGSDEPGTSACPTGKFYCQNVGYKPLIVPSMKVNDGICDCCDGSDEFDSGVACADQCQELGEAWR